MGKKFSRLQRKMTAFIIVLTLLMGSVCSYTAASAAKKPSLVIKTAQYTRTNQTKNVKKKQTIRVKNLSSKTKVTWKSSNKKLAVVKAGKKGKAKLTVSLKKAGTARITATIRNKKTNKKVKVLKKKISVVTKKNPPTKKPVVPTNTPRVHISETPAVSPTMKPTDRPTTKPTDEPTTGPTTKPTDGPTTGPTTKPTDEPTTGPTTKPTDEPTTGPTTKPTDGPTAEPTDEPTTAPTAEPTVDPIETPVVHTPSPNDLWVATWGSSQYSYSYPVTEPSLAESTFRQIIRVSSGGHKLRFTFSNEYGQTPLEIKSVHIAKPTKKSESDIDTSTDKAVTFSGGNESITIPAGEKAVSDEIDYPVTAIEKIAVSTYFGSVPSRITHHGGARSTSFLQAGNTVSDEIMSSSTTNLRWYVLSNVDVLAPPENQAIVCFGDSITDGFGTEQYYNQTPDNYLRWTDVLAENLQSNKATQHLSVINMGIGGNSIFGGSGPAARERFDRDVLQTTGVGYLVFMIGVNDINSAVSPNIETLADRMTAEYTKMINKAHTQGIKVFAGTISPTGGSSYYTAERDEVRQEVNNWLRQMYADGNVDALLDFDELLGDPISFPPSLKAEYNADGLHPSIQGYAAMGKYVYRAMCEEVDVNPPVERTPQPATPEPTPLGDYVVDLSEFISDNKGNPITTYDTDTGTLKIRGDEIVHFALPKTLNTGESVNVIVEGNWTAESLTWRSYLTASAGVTANSPVSNNGTPFSGTPGEPYIQSFTLTSDGGSKYLAIRGAVGPKPIHLDITKITLPLELSTPEPTEPPTPEPGTAVLSDENLGNNGWYVGQVKLNAPEGFTISAGNDPGGVWSEFLILDSTEGADKSDSYYLKDSSGIVSEEKTVSYKVDVTAPDAEINVKDNIFSAAEENIEFNLFYKDTAAVTTAGEDDTSGIEKTEYQIIAGADVYNPNGTWVTGNSFSLSSADKYVVYARVTDEAGNKTIINSNGIAVYTDSFLEKSAGDFCPVTEAPCNTDISVDMNLYGNALEKIVLNGSGDLAENQDYTIIGNKVTFSKDYLETLITGEEDSAVFTFSFLPLGLSYTDAAGNQKPSACSFTITYADELKVPESDIINPNEYVYDLSEFTADSKGITNYDSHNELLKIRGNETVWFALPEALIAGDSINLTVKGNWTGTSKGWRAYLTSSGSSVTAVSPVSNGGTAFTGKAGEPYSQTFTLTPNGAAKFVAIRGTAGGTIDMDIKKITSEIIYSDPTPDPASENYYELDLESQTAQRTSGAATTAEGIKLANASVPSGTSGASVGVNLPTEAGTLEKGDSVVVLIKGKVTGEYAFDSYRTLLASASTSNWNSSSATGNEPPRRSPIAPGESFVIAKEIKFDANNAPTCVYFQFKSRGEITINSMAIEVKKASAS